MEYLNKYRRYPILLCALSSLPALAAEPATQMTMTVYTTEYYPIQYPELADQIYALDEVDRLETVSAEQFQLSSDPDIAEQQAQALLQSTAWHRYEQDFKRAYEGISDAWRKGIMKVPAIYFISPNHNNPYVIYGMTDLQQAVAVYQNQVN